MAQTSQEFHKNTKNLSPEYSEPFGITKAVLPLWQRKQNEIIFSLWICQVSIQFGGQVEYAFLKCCDKGTMDELPRDGEKHGVGFMIAPL